MSRLGFDLCENCDRLWNEGGGHDVKTCPGCDLTEAIQGRYKAEVELKSFRAVLQEIRKQTWGWDFVIQKHGIDPAGLNNEEDDPSKPDPLPDRIMSCGRCGEVAFRWRLQSPAGGHFCCLTCGDPYVLEDGGQGVDEDETEGVENENT